MRRLVYVIGSGILFLFLSSPGWTQVSTDRSEIDRWLKESANQGDIALGTKITPENWQQYKAFMPVGMQKLFAGIYRLKNAAGRRA
jgi:hypothetical protein